MTYALRLVLITATAFVLVAFTLAVFLKTTADAGETGSPLDPGSARSDWFKALTMPVPGGGSCCDESDCEVTASDWRDGQWWAAIGGEMVPVPNDRVLTGVKPIEAAVICHSAIGHFCSKEYGCFDVTPRKSVIFCFVPGPSLF